MRNSILLGAWVLAALLATIVAHAPAFADTNKGHWQDRRMLVLVRNGNTPIITVAGDTQIDKPKTFNCESAKGCLITFSIFARADFNNGDVILCSQVDGIDAPPASCTPYHPDPIINRQSANVPQGQHTIRTIARDTAGGDQISVWQVEYTIYEK